jgi:hypothetical protein
MTLIPPGCYSNSAINGNHSQDQSLDGLAANQMDEALFASFQKEDHMHPQGEEIAIIQRLKGEKHG